ncbi:hypothetical protein [Candidatus Avelusimicrobium luingense]|uniref:hypothetical protein n=1 Tax=Candidatus Avelusimicrobium luingense TaxID=3416211 RepID=UPI003D128A8A
MKYWVYINNKVTGPFTAGKLVTLNGFTPDTLICSEDAANSGNQEWVKASTVFEFEQPAPVQTPTTTPAEQVATAAATAAAVAPAASNDAIVSALMEKLDMLTNQLTGMQSKIDRVQGKLDGMQEKMDGMQNKIDESIATQQQNAERTEVLTQQIDHMAHTIHPESKESAPEDTDLLADTPTENFITPQDTPAENAAEAPAETQENTPAETPTETPAEAPAETPVGTPASDLDKPATEEDSLLDKAGDALVLNAALETLRMPTPDNQDDKENTFQDLLTPAQAKTLAQEAQANQAQAKQEQEKEQEQKEELINELTTPPQSTDVVDQLIQEKEEDEAKKSMTMRILSAGAAVFGLGKKKSEPKPEEQKEEPAAEEKQPEPEQPAQEGQTEPEVVEQEPTAEEKQPEGISLSEQNNQENPADIELVTPSSDGQTTDSAEELPEKQDLNLEDMGEDQPSLTISPDTPKLQQVEEITAQPQALQAADVADVSQEESQTKIGERLQASPDNQSVLPSLDSNDAVGETFAQEQKDLSPQELVPNAKEEKPEDLISEADLQIAFADQKTHEEESVEKLFGLASAGGAVAATQGKEEHIEQLDNALPSLDDINNTSSTPEKQPASQESDPNGISEVELKAGSTYLISDFVPPALSENKDGNTTTNLSNQNNKDKDDIELQEMVPGAQTATTTDAPKDAVSDVTVSQIVLENTIKAKRGAALDIKTVPLVPEPAQSDRLQIEGMDDINTQHDIKSAEAEPAGKMVKMIGGSLFALLLAAIIYGMLAFMNLIPQQFNVFAKKQAAEVAQQQDAQINEMLGTDEQLPTPVNAEEQTPVTEQQNPQDAVLTEVKNYVLPNGKTLQAFIEAKHPAAVNLITWDISTAVDPDNYSVLVKVPPENPQSFKISYRFNYNAVTKALDPTISDAKNLLDSAAAQ